MVAGASAAAFSVPVWPTPRAISLASSVTEVGAATTVMAAEAFLPLWVLTVMVATPTPTAVTTPFSFTVATEGSLLEKLTVPAEPEDSVYLHVPVWPTLSVALAGEMLTEVGAFLTVTVTLAVLEPHFTVMVAVPAFFAVTTPEASTVATEVLLEE